MPAKSITLACAFFGILLSAPATACGDSEAGLSCDDAATGAEASAKWMLKRVVAAVDRDESGALAAFTAGADGFRTADTYVFCVNPDGVMGAHPNPILRGHDVRDLHDRSGHYFIKAMMRDAKPGEISVIHYLFPKPGSTVEEPKTTYYTRAGRETCGVGVYDADTAAPKLATPEARVATLRAKLDRAMPPAARADWTAFLEALNQADDAKTVAMSQAREKLRAADAALLPAKN
jgi:hypothetical protein